jgi:hypothetical protein
MFFDISMFSFTPFFIYIIHLPLFLVFVLFVLFMIPFTSIPISVSVSDVFLNHISKSSVYFAFSDFLLLSVLFVSEQLEVSAVFKYKLFAPKRGR